MTKKAFSAFVLNYILDCINILLSWQVSDTLKKFAVKVTTSSVKERKEILEELKECINGKSEFWIDNT